MANSTGDSKIEYPVKEKEIHNHHMDSTVWNDFSVSADVFFGAVVIDIFFLNSLEIDSLLIYLKYHW
tara:strand:- start:1048 stop:1248 length:201 start_codon:yes stop_codon:yes gene_type:complete